MQRSSGQSTTSSLAIEGQFLKQNGSEGYQNSGDQDLALVPLESPSNKNMSL